MSGTITVCQLIRYTKPPNHPHREHNTACIRSQQVPLNRLCENQGAAHQVFARHGLALWGPGREISFRFYWVTALSETGDHRHHSPRRVPIGRVCTRQTPGGLRPDFRTVSQHITHTSLITKFEVFRTVFPITPHQRSNTKIYLIQNSRYTGSLIVKYLTSSINPDTIIIEE